ncbi:MAG: phosphoribosyltransferase family protein [Gammaproteobacteria bacterium]|nr:phosphoribosyltransferase family protein [Gammaproteobacteria bacterium]
MSELMLDHLRETPAGDLPQRLIPVPMHPKRMRQRGFNQALEIARHLSRALQIPLDYQSIARSLETVPQATLPHDKRRRNVHGTFTVRRKISCDKVAIIDDVMTTGHTAHELARVLRRQGIQQIEVWVLART